MLARVSISTKSVCLLLFLPMVKKDMVLELNFLKYNDLWGKKLLKNHLV
jgi:hypothetical protein